MSVSKAICRTKTRLRRVKKYAVRIFFKARPYDGARDLKEQKFFFTAAGLLRYARKIAERYPKDARKVYRFIYLKGDAEIELFRI